MPHSNFLKNIESSTYHCGYRRPLLAEHHQMVSWITNPVVLLEVKYFEFWWDNQIWHQTFVTNVKTKCIKAFHRLQLFLQITIFFDCFNNLRTLHFCHQVGTLRIWHTPFKLRIPFINTNNGVLLHNGELIRYQDMHKPRLSRNSNLRRSIFRERPYIRLVTTRKPHEVYAFSAVACWKSSFNLANWAYNIWSKFPFMMFISIWLCSKRFISLQ